MKLVQYEHSDQGKLTIHVVPSHYEDRAGKRHRISPRFSWSTRHYAAKSHPMQVVIERATGIVRAELQEKHFGVRVLGFGSPERLSPIFYDTGKWRRSHSRETVFYDGGGYEIAWKLTGNQLKQTVQIREAKYLQPIVEKLYLEGAAAEAHRSGRVRYKTERGQEENFTVIKLMEGGEVLGQIHQGCVYNADHWLPLSYRLVDDGKSVLLITELPEEVKSWAFPIFVDPTTSVGFSKNCGVLRYDAPAGKYIDWQHPDAIAAASASSIYKWDDASFQPQIDNEGVFYADIHAPHYLKTAVRQITSLKVYFDNWQVSGSVGGEVKATVLPMRLRPVGMYWSGSSWVRFSAGDGEHSGVSAQNAMGMPARLGQWQSAEVGPWGEAEIFSQQGAVGGRLQEMLNDFFNSDREDTLTLLLTAQRSATFNSVMLDKSSPVRIEITYDYTGSMSPRYNSLVTEPTISFVEDSITASGLQLYSSMGVSLRDMLQNDYLQQGDNLDPFKLDQRANVRDDYYYFDPLESPFNFMPNPLFARDLHGALGGATWSASAGDIPDLTCDAIAPKKLTLQCAAPVSLNLSDYFAHGDMQGVAHHICLIPLHSLEFSHPHVFSMWAKGEVPSGWRAAIVHGYNYSSGKWDAAVLKDGGQIGESASWKLYSARFTPGYSTPFGASRPAQANGTRAFDLHNLPLIGVASPYSCHLMLWSEDVDVTGKAVSIYAPVCTRTHGGSSTPRRWALSEIDLAADPEYSHALTRKGRIFHANLRGGYNPTLNLGPASFGGAGVQYSSDEGSLPYVSTSTRALYLDPANGSTLRYDLVARPLDEGSLELWYCPRHEVEQRSGKLVSRLGRYDLNGGPLMQDGGDPAGDVSDSYELNGVIFDHAPRHILSLGNLRQVGSAIDRVALSGAGMSLVRVGNSLVWMIREPGFAAKDGSNPEQNNGLTNQLDCVRPGDKAFYKCQFDIPESMIAGLIPGNSAQEGWMHIKLVWGPRMEMYVNGQLVGINPHQGFVTQAAMSEAGGETWNNAATGNLSTLLLGNMTITHREWHDLSQPLQFSDAASDRGFYYTLQSDNCMIQELGVSSVALSQVHAATRADRSGSVGEIDNAELVSKGEITAIADAQRTVSAVWYGDASGIELDVSDDMQPLRRGADGRYFVRIGSAAFYAKSYSKHDGVSVLRPYWTVGSYFPDRPLMSSEIAAIAPTFSSGTSASVTLIEPGAQITYSGYVPLGSSYLYLRAGGKTALITQVTRTVTPGATQNMGSFTVDRLGANACLIKGDWGVENAYNGYQISFDGTTWLTVRDWHTLRNGWVVAHTEETLPTSLGVKTVQMRPAQYSCALTTTSPDLFGLTYDHANRSAALLSGEIEVLSCAPEDRGVYRITGATGSAWCSSDKLGFENPYPPTPGVFKVSDGSWLWFDGLWHVATNAALNVVGDASTVLVEDRAGTVTSPSAYNWIVPAGAHAIFKPGVKLGVSARSGIGTLYVGSRAANLDSTPRYYYTPKPIAVCADAKNALVFQACRNELISFGSCDTPPETGRWIIEGRSSELATGFTGQRRMEYGDFSLVITDADATIADWTGYRTGSSYTMQRLGGITLSFHTSEQHAGTPMAGGCFYPHLMPLYSVNVGLDSFWNSGAAPNGPDGGNDAVLYNSNRWCRFPFHYQQVKQLYGKSGDDLANGRYLVFNGRARQTDKGVMRVELAIKGSRWLQEGFGKEQVASRRVEKFLRLAAVGESTIGMPSMISRALDLANAYRFISPAPQLWFDGRDWNLRQGGTTQTLLIGDVQRAPVGGFMFRSIYGETFDMLDHAADKGWLGGNGASLAQFLLVADGRNDAPGRNHPCARVELATPVYFNPNDLSPDETTSGYQSKQMLVYPGVILGGSYGGLNVPAGIGGPAWAGDPATNFAAYAYNPQTGRPFTGFVGHLKLRAAEGANFPYDWEPRASRYEPAQGGWENTVYVPACNAFKSIVIYKAQTPPGGADFVALGGGSTRIMFLNNEMKSLQQEALLDGRWYPPQASDMAQWWSPRIAQPQSFRVLWNLGRDLANLDGRRVRLIGFALDGRRHVSLQSQAPLWRYPNDAQLALEAPGSSLEQCPQSARLRKADLEHVFRYPFAFNGVSQFNRMRIVGDQDSPYVLSEGGVHSLSVRTDERAVFSSPELFVMSDDLRAPSVPATYKSVATGQTRTLGVTLSNHGAPAALEAQSVTLTLALSDGGEPFATLKNRSRVVVGAEGATLLFDGAIFGGTTGAVYGKLTLADGQEFAISGGQSISILRHPNQNLQLYRNADHPDWTVFMMNGETMGGVTVEGKANPMVSSPHWGFHWVNDNLAILNGYRMHVQKRVSNGHPAPRWDMRVAKAGSDVADLEAIDRALCHLDASNTQGESTRYSVADVLATRAEAESSEDMPGRGGEQDLQSLTVEADYLRVIARSSGAHKGSSFKLYLSGYVCGQKTMVEMTDPLMTLEEQDAPELEALDLAFSDDRSPKPEVIVVEKPLNEQSRLSATWTATLRSKAATVRPRANFKPGAGLFIYTLATPQKLEFSPENGGDAHETEGWIAGGDTFELSFTGSYIPVDNDADPRGWTVQLGAYGAAAINRDDNGCPYLYSRSLTASSPAIKILGPPALQIVGAEQLREGSSFAPLAWNTRSAGCVRLELDISILGDETYPTHFIISHDGSRAFVRPHNFTPETSALWRVGSGQWQEIAVANQRPGGAWTPDYEVNPENGDQPHFTLPIGETTARLRMDVDLKHFQFGGKLFDGKAGVLKLTVKALRTEPNVMLAVKEIDVPYECRDPYDFSIAFNPDTFDYSRGVFRTVLFTSRLRDTSNVLMNQPGGFQYSLGLESGNNAKDWTPVPYEAVALPSSFGSKWNTIYFRALDQYGNAALYVLPKPWDTDQPLLASGQKLLPQNADPAKEGIDIHSGESLIHVRFPEFKESCPKTWGVELEVNGETLQGSWQPPVDKPGSMIPVGKHWESGMSQWSPEPSGWAPIWHGFTTNDFTKSDPPAHAQGWWFMGDNSGSGGELLADSDLGTPVFHAWGSPRVALQNADITMHEYSRAPISGVMWQGQERIADRIWITLKADAGRGSNGYTNMAQPQSPPTWRCRFAWRNQGEEQPDGTFAHWKDFFVFDDGLWHTYELDMSGEQGWLDENPENPQSCKEQFYIVFGADYEHENYKQRPEDDQTVYFRYMIGSGDTTNIAAAGSALSVYLAHFGVAVATDIHRANFYTPVTLPRALDGDDEVYVTASLTDWTGRIAKTQKSELDKYYVIPRAPGKVYVDHNKGANGALEAKILGVSPAGEPSPNVQYSIERRLASPQDDVNWAYGDGWEPVLIDGQEGWKTSAQWNSAAYIMGGVKEGQRYFFRARARNPRNYGCVSEYGPQSEWFSDYITPQVIGCSHFSDAVHLYKNRATDAAGDAEGRAWSWKPYDIGEAMREGAWIANANGRFYFSDWNDGVFYGSNVKASSDPAYWCHLRNFAGGYSGDAYNKTGGSTIANHPVDGFFFTQTWGESTRDTIPTDQSELITAAQTLAGYPLLQIGKTLSPPTLPAIGYLHIRPCYKNGATYVPFAQDYTVHLAIYFDAPDGKHPVSGKVKSAAGAGIDGTWDDPNFDMDIYRVKAQVAPILGVKTAQERQQYHSFRLHVRPSGSTQDKAGDWSGFYAYDPANPNQQTDVAAGGLKEHACYELAFEVRNSAGVTGPGAGQWQLPTYTLTRPAGELVNIYPSGFATRFVLPGLSHELPGGYYEIWDWMNGVSVGTVAMEGKSLYDAALTVEGGLQGAYLVKAYNCQGATLPEYDTEDSWNGKPWRRQPGAGWKPALRDYISIPRIPSISVQVGYDAGITEGNNKFLRALPERGVNQDAVNRPVYYLPDEHPFLTKRQRQERWSDKTHSQAQYLTEVWKSVSGVQTRLGYAVGDGTLAAQYGEGLWLTMDAMRMPAYKTVSAAIVEPAAQYGFRMCARNKIAPGTAPEGDEEDDALVGSYWSLSPWTTIQWGETATHTGDDYSDLLHIYVKTGGNNLYDMAHVMQDVDPRGKEGVFKDVRVSYRMVDSETTDVEQYPGHVQSWIREQWANQQGQDPAWRQLKAIPTSLARVTAEVTFTDPAGSSRTIQRIVNLWDSEAKNGHSFTGWSVHNEQKQDLVSIHSDYGLCKFDQYAPEVAHVAASGWISQQRAETWYHMKWDLYTDVLEGLETVNCPGSLKAYGVDWSAVTNVRLRLWAGAIHGAGIYSEDWQPEGLEWRGDPKMVNFEHASCGVLVRDFSIGWTSQVDAFGKPVYGEDAWNGQYEWDVTPMNLIHNPQLDVYEREMAEPDHLPMAKPREFIARKTMPTPANSYEYDSYVKELLEE